MLKGDRVTRQPPCWYDKTPVANWPDPQFVGVVLKLENLRGMPYARVLYPSGRKEFERLDALHLIHSASR